ncbi:MAG: hypothetical protein B7Z80_19680 [Rhodospirillales bacterium 20-64-7]|nr:MAG: hypothetical protein B7Z80_19680 [Rhodospirillales bacterium 20-64-7]
MSHAVHQPDSDLKTECQLLEAAVAEARADKCPDVPHDQVRAEMLQEIERLKRRERVVFKTEDLSEAEIQAVTQGRMDARHDYLNAELDPDIGNPLPR